MIPLPGNQRCSRSRLAPNAASRSVRCGGALNHPAARSKAVDALHTWLDAASTDSALFSAVQELIADLVAAGDAREQQRLDYWLDRWARDPKQPCTSAADIRLNMSS